MLLEVFYLLHLLLFTVALLHGSRLRASSSSRSRCCAVACLAVGRRARLGTRLRAPPPRLHLSLSHRFHPPFLLLPLSTACNRSFDRLAFGWRSLCGCSWSLGARPSCPAVRACPRRLRGTARG